MKLESDLGFMYNTPQNTSDEAKTPAMLQVAGNKTLLKNATNIWDVTLTYSPGSEDIR